MHEQAITAPSIDLSQVIFSEEAFESQTYSPPLAPSTPATLTMNTPRTILEPFRSRALDFEQEAKTLKVQDDETQTAATSLAGQIRKAAKAVEEARKNYVSPFNEHIREVNGLAKEIATPLERAERSLKAELSTYATTQELKRRKAEEDARKAAEEQQRLLNAEAAKLGVEAPLVPEVIPPDTHNIAVRTASGTSYTRKTWAFSLLDLSAVPLEYMSLNEQAVNAAIRAGVREIPGLRIFEKSTIAIRS